MMEETKRISKNPSTRRRSSITRTHSSLEPSSMMVPVTAAKQSYEEMSELKPPKANSFSNSTRRSLNIIITQENHRQVPLPKPHEEAKSSFSEDESKKASAKLVLHGMCMSKRWKPPLYDCCNVDGPSNMRLFTYKVVVEIKDSSGTTTFLECFGDPKRKKKAASEHAAEGALWYLDHVKGQSDKSA